MHQEDTRQKLLDCAKKEFLELGYQKASLRHICKNAGVTTGALYFFFQDKNDLFDQLVHEFAQNVRVMIQEHTEQEIKDFQNKQYHDFLQDEQLAKEIIRYFYAHKEIGKLLLDCSMGSSYEGYIDGLVKYMEERNKLVLGGVDGEEAKRVFNECTQHWFAHLVVDAFLHILSHDFTEERALQQIEIIVMFMRGGFSTLIQKTQE